MVALDTNTFKSLKAQIESRKREAISRAESEAKHAIDALGVLEELFTNGALSIPEGDHKVMFATSGTVNLNNGRAAWVTPQNKPFQTKQAVRRIIEQKTPEHIFSQPIIYDNLFMLHEEIRRRPHKSVRGQIAALLKGFVREGLIVLVKEADGQEPAEYRLAPDAKLNASVSLYSSED